ncbi:HEAT repeat domain-containing protein, partial [Moorena bouillonii]|uniref:HEAT repeat domain-containing protein n=1 Tax=Moorena bouillonii TaxID=207920 RepID=UPI001301649E
MAILSRRFTAACLLICLFGAPSQELHSTARVVAQCPVEALLGDPGAGPLLASKAYRLLLEGGLEERLDLLDSCDLSDTETPPEVISAFVRYVEDEPDFRRVTRVAQWHHLEEGWELLIEKLMAHPSASVRANAYHFDSESPEAQALLEQAWERETVPWARAELLQALGYTDSEVHVEPCLALVADPDPALALAAVECVGNYGPDGGAAALIRQLEADRGLRPALLWAIDRWVQARKEVDIPDRLRIEALWDVVEESERGQMLRALARLGSPRARAKLEQMLRDEDEETVSQALSVVAVWPDDAFADTLIGMATEGPRSIRRHAIDVLGRQPSPEVEEWLRNVLLSSQDARIRMAALSSLSGYQAAAEACRQADDPAQCGVEFYAARPQVKALLERVATGDSPERLREQARYTLELMSSGHVGWAFLGVPFSSLSVQIQLREDLAASSFRCQPEPGLLHQVPAYRLSAGGRL